MKKTIEVIKKLSDQQVINKLNDYEERNGLSLALSKECRDHLAIRGIYWPYKKFEDELQ